MNRTTENNIPTDLPQSVSSEQNLERTDVERFSCEKCGVSLRSKKALRMHIKNNCDDSRKAFVCDVCGKVCHRLSRFKVHMDVHENQKKYKCTECEKGFNTSGARNAHVKQVHQRQRLRYYCTHCPFRSESKEHVESHERIHSLPEGAEVPTPFKCRECGLAFISKYALNVHTGLKHRKRKCKKCGREFPTQNDLEKHNREMHKAKKKCPICGKGLSTSVSLNLHLENVHSIANPARYKMWAECDKCSKRFTTMAFYIKHQEVVHKQVVSPDELEIYREDEETEQPVLKNPPVSCQFCQKTFKNRNSLSGHMYSFHNPESSMEATCDLCGKVCKNRTSLLRHKYMVHPPADESEATCDVCGKKFKSRGIMFQHKYTEHKPLGPDEVSCDVCGRRFKDAVALLNHSSVHKSTGSIICPVCGAKYKKLGLSYTKHMKTKHNIDEGAHVIVKNEEEDDSQDE